MYLLIRFQYHCHIQCYLYLHPTMYLLILSLHMYNAILTKFTSHYVSINSGEAILPLKPFYHLHPTMYLLIRNISLSGTEGISIYIPLCIY